MTNPFAASDALFEADLREFSDSVESIVPSGTAQLSSGSLPVYRTAYNTGDKWQGGFGLTELLFKDYWTLRARSVQMFEENLYARGVIRRLVTNMINTGLQLEATPEEVLLGYKEDELADWSEDVENRFALLESNPILVDQNERLTWGQMQAEAYRMALIGGDVLCVLRQDSRTKLPRMQVINAERIQTPLDKMFAGTGNKVREGVEIDSQGRYVAFHVRQDDGTSKRLPAVGEKSGRRLAWLQYANDKRSDDVRGTPFLGLMLQSLKEIDRYRDSVQVKATINAMLAMFIEQTEPGIPTRSLTGGAAGAVKRTEAIDVAQHSGEQKRFNVETQMPGVVLDRLGHGEKPHGFQSNGTDEKFGDFQMSILSLIAWGSEIPPEILTLSFNSNYSASKAANNEFDMKLRMGRTDWGLSFCQPFYNEWLFAQVLSGKIQARGLLESYRNPAMYDITGAWTSAGWSGQIKPSVDPVKQIEAYALGCKEGFYTRDLAAKEISGTKYSKNVQKLERENLQLYEANRPLSKLEQLKKPEPADPQSANPNADTINDENPLDETPADASRSKLRVIGQ